MHVQTNDAYRVDSRQKQTKKTNKQHSTTILVAIHCHTYTPKAVVASYAPEHPLFFPCTPEKHNSQEKSFANASVVRSHTSIANPHRYGNLCLFSEVFFLGNSSSKCGLPKVTPSNHHTHIDTRRHLQRKIYRTLPRRGPGHRVYFVTQPPIPTHTHTYRARDGNSGAPTSRQLVR